MRTYKYQQGALSVILQPHDHLNFYIELFKEANELRRPIKLRGDRYGILNYITEIEDRNEVVGLTGLITTFTRIDPEADWFDFLKLTDFSTPIQIPPNAGANKKVFHFYFDLPTHSIIFESWNRGNSFGHQTAQRFFKGLFTQGELQSKYPDVEVIIIQDKQELHKMLETYFIRNLTIEILKPNAFYESLNTIEKFMNDQNAKRYITTLVNEKGESIRPNKETRKLSEVAIETGKVRVIGNDENGKKVDISTENFPVVNVRNYFQKSPFSEIFLDNAVAWISKLFKNR